MGTEKVEFGLCLLCGRIHKNPDRVYPNWLKGAWLKGDTVKIGNKEK
jgi:hypothetical protein